MSEPLHITNPNQASASYKAAAALYRKLIVGGAFSEDTKEVTLTAAEISQTYQEIRRHESALGIFITKLLMREADRTRHIPDVKAIIEGLAQYITVGYPVDHGIGHRRFSTRDVLRIIVLKVRESNPDQGIENAQIPGWIFTKVMTAFLSNATVNLAMITFHGIQSVGVTTVCDLKSNGRT